MVRCPRSAPPLLCRAAARPPRRQPARGDCRPLPQRRERLCVDRDGRRPSAGTRRPRCARHETVIRRIPNSNAPLESWPPLARHWLLITVSTPGGGSSRCAFYAWRNLRRLGAHYLQQSVCVLPATPKTTRFTMRVVTRLRAEGGRAEMLRIELRTQSRRRGSSDAIQRERADEYRELVESTTAIREELDMERRRGRTTYTRARGVRRDLAATRSGSRIRARDYFDAPGARRAAAAVASCRGGARPFRARSPVRGARRVRVRHGARPARGRPRRRLMDATRDAPGVPRGPLCK